MEKLIVKDKDKHEVEILTHLALTRLNEEEYYPGERINALLNHKILDRIPLQIIDNSSRLIGSDIYDFFFEPVVRYKSLCAQIIRWGTVMTETSSRIYSYSVGEAMGAQLKYSRIEAPSTERYILNTVDDLEKLIVPPLHKYIEKDKCLIHLLIEQFGNKLGTPCCFMYPPFSWVGTYLRDANMLFQDLFDCPEFVHQMCRIVTDMELKIIDELTETTSCSFFMPGGFSDVLSPEQYSEFHLPYMAELIDKNRNCLFYLPVPGTYQQIEELYKTIEGHNKLICMGSSIGAHTPIRNEKDLQKLCSILDSFNRPYQLAIDQNTMRFSSPDEIIDRVSSLIKIGTRENMMIRTDTLDPSTPHENIDALVWSIKKYGAY